MQSDVIQAKFTNERNSSSNKYHFRHWLYGDKVLSEDRVRGWFPRRCAIEIINNGRDSKKSK